MILFFNFSSSWMTSDSSKYHPESPYSLLPIKSKTSRVHTTRIYARHAHVTRERKKANIPFKHTIPLPMDNLLFRKRVLMKRQQQLCPMPSQCTLREVLPSQHYPSPGTAKWLLPNYVPVHSKEGNLALYKKYFVNNLIYPAAYCMKPDNNPVCTLPTDYKQGTQLMLLPLLQYFSTVVKLYSASRKA